MTDELLDRIAGDPDNELEHLRVYADQLILAGDPRGELINVATQRELADTHELRRREEALLRDQHAMLDRVIGRALSPTYTWRRGFLDTIAFDYSGDEAFDPLPKLADLPIARLLRSVTLSTLMMDGRGDVGPVIAELARLAPRFPRLTEIAIRYAGNFGNPWIDGPSDIHDVSPLYGAFPKLERLELGGDAVQLGNLALPKLHTLIAPRLDLDQIKNLVAAQLPRLARLDLGFWTQRIDNVPATFGPLLHRTFPMLNSLSIAPRTEESIAYVIDELPTCPLGRSITELAFRGITLEPAHVEALLRHAPALRRLERLELAGRTIAASVERRLFEAFGRACVLI